MTILVIYSILLIAFVFLVDAKKRNTSLSFLLANRSCSNWTSSLSIAASWIWAPAIFVSTQIGYTWGLGGLAWFVLPNMLALVLFSFFAVRVRKRHPEGYTMIDALQNQSKTTRNGFLIVHLAVQILSFAMQVTAGAFLITAFSGLPFTLVALLMIVIPLIYSLYSGLSSSILTDAIQYLIIIAAIIVIYFSSDFDFSNIKLETKDLNPLSPLMLLNFGIASFFTLSFGIFSDHQQWQRVFSMPASVVKKQYFHASLLHGLVTLSLGLLGYWIKLTGFSTENYSIVGASYIAEYLPPVALSAFMLMAMSGLISTIDSCYCAFSSLWARHVSSDQNKIKSSRWAMLFLALFGLILTLFKLPIITIWMFVGLIRIATFLPTIWIIMQPKIKVPRLFLGIILAISINCPIYIYAAATQSEALKTGTLLSCFIMSLIILGLKKVEVR